MSTSCNGSGKQPAVPTGQTLHLVVCKDIRGGRIAAEVEADIQEQVQKQGNTNTQVIVAEELDFSIRNLRFLQTLVFRGCFDIITHLPESISTLTNLQQLNLYNCRILEKLPQLPDSLTSLDLEYCVSVQNLSIPLAGLNRLTTLTLGNCPGVRSVHELLAGGLLGLRELNVSSDTDALEYFDDWKYANLLWEKEMQNGGCLKIALVLRAWPRQGFKLLGVDLGFHFKDLGLLEKPVECGVVHDVFAYWHWPKTDMTPNTALALEHFCTSLDKVTAFVMSQHKRLGCLTSLFSLGVPELALVMIADEVLNRKADLTSTWIEPKGMRAAFAEAEMEETVRYMMEEGGWNEEEMFDEWYEEEMFDDVGGL